MNRTPGFSLYCFPDISGVNPSGKGGVGRESQGFRPCSFLEGSLGQKAAQDDGEPAAVPPFAQTGAALTREIEQEAYSKGFCEGEEAGKNSSLQALAPVLTNFRDALQELSRVKREIYLCAEKEVVELALAVARKIVCQELSVSRDIILGVVREALKTVEDQEEITIKLNPRDLEVLRDKTARVPNLFDKMGKVRFAEDPQMSSGGCVIETALGEVDARIERQLEAVEEAFRSELAEGVTAG